MNWCVAGLLIMFVLYVTFDCVIVLLNVDVFVLFCSVVFCPLFVFFLLLVSSGQPLSCSCVAAHL